MKRYGFIALFLVVLAAPFVLRQLMGRSAPARPADEPTLVVACAHNEGIRREFANAFSSWHRAHYGTGVYVDYRNYGGSSDIRKYFDSAAAAGGDFHLDVVWGGGDVLFERQLKKYLQPIALDPKLLAHAFPKPDLNGVALLDTGNPKVWFGVALSSFGIIYNKDVIRHLGMNDPTRWDDLTDPRYRGWIALADPTQSGSVKMAMFIIIERAMADAAAQGRSEDTGWAKGMGTLRLIASNARLFTDSAELIPAMVSSGDAAAGMAIDFYGRSQIAAIGARRLGYVEPTGATAITPDPVAVVKGAAHRELAVHFVEFLLSDAGQRLWITRPGAPGGPRDTALFRLPVSPSIYAAPSNFVVPADPYRAAGDFNKSNAREKTFGIMAELIQFSCMDLLDDLRQTRAIILASPHAARLDARLGMFPFDQKEALRRMAQWRKATPLQQLQLQREWTGEFREEYARLRREAAK